MGYRTSRSYDNLERRIFDGVGEYDIPEISPVTYEGGCDWIGFNYAKSCKIHLKKAFISFWMITSFAACGQT